MPSLTTLFTDWLARRRAARASAAVLKEQRLKDEAAWEYVGTVDYTQTWQNGWTGRTYDKAGTGAVYVNHSLRQARVTNVGEVDYNAYSKDRKLVITRPYEEDES